MADQDVDKNYAPMRSRHGEAHASANGYIGNWFFRREQRYLESQLKPGLTLDIACGSGLMLRKVSDLEVIGVDFNETACRQAASNGVSISRGDAFKLPFSDNVFDNAINCQFLNQQPPDVVLPFIAEAARVLKPNGELHVMWRGAHTLVHKSVNCASNLLDRLRGNPLFPQYRHPPKTLVNAGITHGLKPAYQSMTLPIGPQNTAPGNPIAFILGASHYLRLIKIE